MQCGFMCAFTLRLSTLLVLAMPAVALPPDAEPVTTTPTGSRGTPAGTVADSPANRLSIADLRDRSMLIADVGRRLLAAYPSHLSRVEDTTLVWRDGTRMPLDDGAPLKPDADWLATPDIKDMFRYQYPAGDVPTTPPLNADPGRARNTAFFQKMYGDCRKDEAASRLVDVAWMPKRSRLKLKATTVNGVAERLGRISAELEALPASYARYLLPPAGAYNCRAVAGTDQLSAHGYGIAVDIAVARSHYWRWSPPDAARHPVWTNRIPLEIVRIFERHGFIWGGRWSHYDTMHFEYRPELLAP